eukprot:s73_g18.t2
MDMFCCVEPDKREELQLELDPHRERPATALTAQTFQVSVDYEGRKLGVDLDSSDLLRGLMVKAVFPEGLLADWNLAHPDNPVRPYDKIFEVNGELSVYNMSITVRVGLLSGKTAAVTTDLDEEVANLNRRAQASLGVGKGRLLDSSGRVLDARAPVKRARLQNGDSLTLQINRVQVRGSKLTFAAILGDGSVVTWDRADLGGDSSKVQAQLENVQQIQAATSAFHAILGDGSVVTWGDAGNGGDSSSVQDQLKNVLQIQATQCAFAAILEVGSVVTWGHRKFGGNSSAVHDQLKNVQQIQATSTAFAAILSNGSVVTWGRASCGGDSSAVQNQLKNVQQIQAANGFGAGAFAAILGDGSVVTWGDSRHGGDSSAVQDQLKNVQQIQATPCAFAAILGGGSVVTWGHANFGGVSSCAVQDQLRNVEQIQAAGDAFAAILGDGSVVTWGHADYGGDSSAVQDQLKNVQQIQATGTAFAAILVHGSVVTWGDAEGGGDSSVVQDQLKNVRQIQATGAAFAAILADGSVVTWGGTRTGGDSRLVQDQLKHVQQIQASTYAFAAILADGSVAGTAEHLEAKIASSGRQLKMAFRRPQLREISMRRTGSLGVKLLYKKSSTGIVINEILSDGLFSDWKLGRGKTDMSTCGLAILFQGFKGVSTSLTGTMRDTPKATKSISTHKAPKNTEHRTRSTLLSKWCPVTASSQSAVSRWGPRNCSRGYPATTRWIWQYCTTIRRLATGDSWRRSCQERANDASSSSFGPGFWLFVHFSKILGRLLLSGPGAGAFGAILRRDVASTEPKTTRPSFLRNPREAPIPQLEAE